MFRNRRFIPLVALWLGAAVASTQEPAGIAKVASIEGITEYRLDNGLKVLLIPDRSKPTVTVNLTVLVGSRHEGYGESGMAHLLEHMLFKGTPRHPNIPKELADRGAQFNGTTSVDRTNYFETLNASDENLEWAIGLEADRLINSYVKREDLLSEFSVVRNEFERGENSPSGVLRQRMMAAAYEWHNYGKSTIGNRSDIERVPIDRLQAFYRKYYQPDNAVLIVAGQFETDKTLGMIAKHFGPIKRPERQLETTYTEEPAQDGERTVILRRVGEIAVVGALYHVPAASHPDFQAVEVLADVLTNAPSGLLYKELVEKRLATSVSGGAYDCHDPGVIGFDASVRKGEDPDVVRDKLIALLEAAHRQGIEAEDVERSKKRFAARFESARNNTTGIAIGLSGWVGKGDWRLMFLNRDRMEKTTVEQVRKVAEQYLTQSNRTVGMFLPTAEPARSTIPAAPDLANQLANYTGRQAVKEGEAFDPTPANIESRTERGELPGGLKYALLPKSNRGETVELTLTLRFGDEESLKGKVEAVGMLGSLMMRGTKNLSRQQIQDELTKLNARLMLRSVAGSLTATLSTKRANLGAALDVLKQVLREPTLPEAEFETLKRQAISGATAMRSEPMALASQAVVRQLSAAGPDDVRYSPSIEERLARLENLKHEAVVEIYRDFIGGQHGELAIVGDFDRSEAISAVANIVSGWTAPKPYRRIRQLPPPELKRQDVAITTPDKANAIYVAGTAFALKEDDRDYPALALGNAILGGGALSSRLGDRLRQKDGLSYTVQSMVAAGSEDPSGNMMMLAIANPNNIPKVKQAVKEELDRLLADGVTEDELARAKKAQRERTRVGRTRDGALAAMLASGLRLGRTMAYYDDLEKRFDAVTVEQVNAALRKYVDPEKLVVVTAGDFKKKEGPKS